MSGALLAALASEISFGPRIPRSADGRSSPSQRSVDEVSREAALVERVRAGDELALRELLTDYFPRISRFAYGIVGARDVAEDIAQDVLVHIWRHRATWKPRHSIAAYVLGAARNRALNVLKHEAVHRRKASAVTESFTHESERSADVNDQLTAESLVATLRLLVDALPERRRTALRLRYEEGLTYPAMGTVLGISTKSAEQLVALTIQALRKEMRRFR